MHQSIQITPELSKKVSKSIRNKNLAEETDQKGERIQEQKLQKSSGGITAAGKNGDFS